MPQRDPCGNSVDPIGAGRAAALPPGTPSWVTPELVQLTLKTWQPHYDYSLTPEDAVTMILSVGLLLGVLSRR